MANNNLVILQARMSSTRLPGKVLAIINGQPMIFWQIQRIKEAKSIDELIVATSTDQSDDALVEFLELNGVLVHRGPIDDVYERFRQVLNRLVNSQTIVRLTADCPFTMPELIDEMVNKFESSDIDYLSNSLAPTFPDGLDIEIITRTAFLKLGDYPLSATEKEHVTLGLRNRPNKFKIENFSQDFDLSKLRWTVDYEGDLKFAREIYAEFRGQEARFNYSDLLKILEAKPELKNEVSGSLRNVALNEIGE
jgi:spore coat polysaccharide biosynthesis protein SpsF